MAKKQVTLTLRSLSGFFDPPAQRVGANSDLVIKLDDGNMIKGKAVLYFNNAAFTFGTDKTVVIPANKLKETNHCILKDKSESGNVYREWRNIEALVFDLEALDKTGEKQLMAEREFFKNLRVKMDELQAQEENRAKVFAVEYKKWQEEKKKLADEIVKQGNVIKDLQKTVKAILNEPLA